MPKARLHWAHDLLAAVLVGAVSGLVFWLLPPALPAKAVHAACLAAGPGNGEQGLFGVLRHAG